MRGLLWFIGLLAFLGGIGLSVYYFLFFQDSIKITADAANSMQQMMNSQIAPGSGLQADRTINLGLVADRICGVIFGIGTMGMGAFMMSINRGAESKDVSKAATPAMAEDYVAIKNRRFEEG